MQLKYSKNIEHAIYIIKSILQRNIEYTANSGEYKTIPVYFDNKSKAVNFNLYFQNRKNTAAKIEIQSLLPAASIQLTSVKPISDFALQHKLRTSGSDGKQFTPVIANAGFDFKYFTTKTSTLLNISEQLIVLFDQPYTFNVNYRDENNSIIYTVTTRLALTSDSLSIPTETDENGDDIHIISGSFILSPIIIPKIKKDHEAIDIKLTIKTT